MKNNISSICICLSSALLIIFCFCKEISTIDNFISTILSFFSLIATITIYFKTNEIQKNQNRSQTLASLITEYRSVEFGETIQRITTFWIYDCSRDKEKIESMYKSKYDAQHNERGEIVVDNSQKTLHSDRRYLTQYYWSLWLCMKDDESESLLKEGYFNKNEMNFFVILHHMNIACTDSEIYKNLYEETIMPSPVNDDYLKNLYEKFNKYFNKTDDSEMTGILTWSDF